MTFNKIFYSLLFCVSCITKTIVDLDSRNLYNFPGGYDTYLQTLDAIASRSLEWYDVYMKSLDISEQIEFYNGLQDISDFSSYEIAHKKYVATSAQLIALLDRTSIENEGKILQILHSMNVAALKNYPIKTEYELRTGSFFQRCEEYEPFQRALDTFFNDFKSFVDKQSSSALFAQLEETKVALSDFIQIVSTVQDHAHRENLIVKRQYEEKLLPKYYDCLKVISDGIAALTVQGTSEVENVLNETILLYTDAIIRNVNS
jgi:hypothetical protein